MADPTRLEGERVFCHQCENEWDRAHGGLTCPRCEGDFTEIIEPQSTSVPESSRQTSASPAAARESPLQPLFDHNPWNDDLDPQGDDGFTTFEFTSNHGGGRISFTSRSFRMNSPGRNVGSMPPNHLRQVSPFEFPIEHPMGAPAPHAHAGPGTLQDLFSLILQSMQPAMPLRPGAPGGRPPGQQPYPFDLLSQLFNPGNAQHGDMVFTQEAFDRVMTQLMEQNQSGNAPPPAPEEAIKSLKKKNVDQEMLGSDGKAECSICMENVELGDEVTVLPCSHWFHGACVTAWLKEHNTCPHCRRPISGSNDSHEQSTPRRRMGSRSSSGSTPRGLGAEGTRTNPFTIPDSPSDRLEARQSYYGHRRDSDSHRSDNARSPTSNQAMGRRPSTRRVGESSANRGNNSGGGFTGWIRDHLPFP
ncbi:hypothetical protein ABEF95_012846 [Exophiala dermatitidis]